MDPDIKKLLEENLKLTKDNNELLLKVRNHQRWLQFSRLFYWIIIIGVAFGAFYYLKPLLGNLLNLYSGGVSNINSIKDVSKNLDMDSIHDLLKDIKD